MATSPMFSLDFDAIDLDANRQGFLSEPQRQRLDSEITRLSQQGKLMVWMFMAVFAVIMIVGLAIAYNTNQDLNALFSPGNQIVFAVVSGLFLLISFIMIGTNWTNQRRLRHGVIRIVEGKAHVVNGSVSVHGVRLPIYSVELRRGWFSKFVFRFQDDTSLVYFTEGLFYRVYYIPYALPHALSAEEISSL